MNSFRNNIKKTEQWVQRLIDAETPDLSEKERFWWRVWILRFLHFCREPAHDGFGLVPLAKGYLKELKEDPDLEDWRWCEAREALRVFARGIENWHWAGGKTQFRVRTRVRAEPTEAGPDGAAPTDETPSLAEDDSEDTREIPADWLERLRAALRVQRDTRTGRKRVISAG